MTRSLAFGKLHMASKSIVGRDAETEIGQISWFDDRLGYGCLRSGAREPIYIHKDIEGEGHRFLSEGEIVSFVRAQTDEGLKATSIRTVALSQPPWVDVKIPGLRALLRYLY